VVAVPQSRRDAARCRAGHAGGAIEPGVEGSGLATRVVRELPQPVAQARRIDGVGLDLDMAVFGEAQVATPTGTRIRLGPGRFFGEMALLDSSPRTATVTAATPMQVMRISQRRFRQLLEAEPKVSLAIMRELAARVRRLEGESHQ
jgi:CRP-like cAMP-binding protein